jgi:hypothetical protein
MNIVVLPRAYKINIIGSTRAIGVPTFNTDRIAKISRHVAPLPNDIQCSIHSPWSFVRKSRIDTVGKNP